MKRILGLDPGVASIGWALVNEAENDDEKSSIIKLGTRSVPLADGEEQNYTRGKDLGTNAGRTQKRNARKTLDRYQQRRENIKQLLKNAGIISNETHFSEAGKDTTFKTRRDRAMAVTEEIDLESLARVILQINKKRGYKSTRKNQESEDGSLDVDTVATSVLLQKEGITAGQYGLRLLEGGLSAKELPSFFRYDLQNEFNRIWERQSRLYPELNDELKSLLMRKNKRDSEKLFFARLGVQLPEKGDGKNGYLWRSAAATRDCQLDRVAAALCDLRGKMCSSSGLLADITDNSKELALSGRTVGQYQYDLLQEDPNRSLRGQTFYRQDYVDEFDHIWSTQSKFHPELTQELHDQLRFIIKEQRPVSSQNRQIALCQLEHEEKEVIKNGKKVKMQTGLKVCPKASPMFQEFRMWQHLNDLVLIDQEENRIPLTLDERKLLAKKLESTTLLTDVAALELLFGEQNNNYRLNFEELVGNETNVVLLKAYRKIAELTGHNLPASASLQDVADIFESVGFPTDYLFYHPELERKAYKQQPYYRLWHLLFSFEGDSSKTGDEKLIQHIIELTSLPKEYAEILSHVSFQEGYGSLSTKAMRPILKYLKEGESYEVACQKAGYNHSERSRTKEENDARPLKEKLELIPRNQLRNPVVEKIMNQLVGLVNAIIDEYGRPDEIRLELARELKQSKKERDELAKYNIKHRGKNEDAIREICERWPHITHPTQREIQKYRLWQELAPLSYKSLYSNQFISAEKLFSGDVDFEHILPKAKLFNDSYSNKTLEFHSVNNRGKGDMTAFDYVKSLGPEALSAYRKNVETLFKAKTISATKRRMLLTEEKDIPTDFLNRDLALTRYITREAVSLLEQVVRTVNVTTGSVTDRLRQDWELVDVMKELNWERYEKAGLTSTFQTHDGRTIRNIEGWTKRNDHRNHAMDALVVAFTRPAYIQYLNNVNAQNVPNSTVWGIRQRYMLREKDKSLRFRAPMPIKEFRAQAKKKLEEIIVSFRPPRVNPVTSNVNKYRKRNSDSTKIQTTLTPRGQLTEEKNTYGYRQVTRNGELTNIFVHRVPVDVKLDVRKVIDPVLKSLLTDHLARYANDAKKAFAPATLQEDPILWNGAIVKKVTVEVSETTLVPLREKHDLDGNVICGKNGKPLPTDFVAPGSNHQLNIYRKSDGSYYAKMITFFDAVKSATSQKKSLASANHDELVMTLMKGDYVLFEGDGAIEKRIFRVQTLSATDKIDIRFRHVWDATTDENTKLKGSTFYRFRNYDFVNRITKINVDRLGNIIQINI